VFKYSCRLNGQTEPFIGSIQSFHVSCAGQDIGSRCFTVMLMGSDLSQPTSTTLLRLKPRS